MHEQRQSYGIGGLVREMLRKCCKQPWEHPTAGCLIPYRDSHLCGLWRSIWDYDNALYFVFGVGGIVVSLALPFIFRLDGVDRNIKGNRALRNLFVFQNFGRKRESETNSWPHKEWRQDGFFRETLLHDKENTQHDFLQNTYFWNRKPNTPRKWLRKKKSQFSI